MRRFTLQIFVNLLNSFLPNAPFLCPLKISGNRQGAEKGCIGTKWVNQSEYEKKIIAQRYSSAQFSGKRKTPLQYRELEYHISVCILMNRLISVIFFRYEQLSKRKLFSKMKDFLSRPPSAKNWVKQKSLIFFLKKKLLHYLHYFFIVKYK